MKTLSFFVPGKPQPAGSKRAFVLKGGANKGRAIVTDANPKAKDWKADVRAACTYEGQPMECPLQLRLVFYMLRPQSHYGTGKNRHNLKPSAPHFPTTKPDTTKLVRGVEDALTAVVWRDDAQIVRQTALKLYGNREGCDVEVSEYTLL